MNNRVNRRVVGLVALLTFGGLFATSRVVGYNRWRNGFGNRFSDERTWQGWGRTGNRHCQHTEQAAQTPSATPNVPESASITQ